MKLKLPIIVFMVCVLSSCSDNLYYAISRTTDDPSEAALTVRCFDAVNTVSLSWKDDPASDYYVLYRATNGPVLSWQKIYFGTDTSYKDSALSEAELYRYRLDKVRGCKTFTGDNIVLAVATSVTQGLLYDNSSQEKAYELTYKVSSSCYYYKFDDNNFLIDYDWYKITIPQRKKARIKISYNSANSNAWYKYFVPGYESQEIQNEGLITVSNYLDSEQTLYFVIIANPNEFVDSSALTGGAVRAYELQLTEISSL